MNTKTICTITAVASLFISTMASAHEPSKHAGSKEKPNCEAMHKMDSSAMDMNDPVMQAMMQQCGKSTPDGHHDKKAVKPVCTQEHAKLGHCTLEADASHIKQTEPSNDLPPIILKNTLPPIGHAAPMDPSAPPHERAYHRKVYEVPDCENMSNMHHNKNTDAFDPIIQELMKKCEDAEAAEEKSTQEAPKDPAGGEID